MAGGGSWSNTCRHMRQDGGGRRGAAKQPLVQEEKVTFLIHDRPKTRSKKAAVTPVGGRHEAGRVHPLR